jgi:hypothetical protein
MAFTLKSLTYHYVTKLQANTKKAIFKSMIAGFLLTPDGRLSMNLFLWMFFGQLKAI